MVLRVRGPVEVAGNVVLTEPETSVTTPHDALYKRAKDMDSNGVYVPASVNDIARWTLAAGQHVAWSWDLPFGWEHVALRWEACNETAVAGTVGWSAAYRIEYPLIDDLVDPPDATLVVPPVAMGAVQFHSVYNVPVETEDIPTPPFDFLGNSILPVLHVSLTRSGGTLAGLCGVSVGTITRLD